MLLILVIISFAPWVAIGFAMKKLFLKNIRESASVYASHYDISIDHTLTIWLRINEQTPWSEQSFSYRRVLSLFEILAQAFSFGWTAFLLLSIWSLFPPQRLFWEFAGMTGAYILLFFSFYLWSRKWIPRLLTVSIHLPENTFTLQDSLIPFARLLLASAVIGAVCAIFYHYLQLGLVNEYSLFMTGTYLASLISILRLFPVMQSGEFTSHLETLEQVFTDYDIEEFFDYKRELMEEIRANPNFDDWSLSLPDGVGSVVSYMFEEKHDLELMKRADILPEEDLITYPFLVKLLCRNPDVLEFMITRVLDEMKDSIKSWKPQA